MTDKRFYSILGAAILVFLAARVLYLSQLFDSPVLELLVLDSDWYYRWAVSLAGGYGHPPGPFWLGPGYPIALAGLFKITGSSTPELIVITQVVLSLGTLILLVLTVRSLLGRTVALVTAVIASLYAPWVYYDGMILSASWILFLNSLLLYLVIEHTSLVSEKPHDGREWLVWGIVGLVCGASALARPSILIFAVLLVAAVFVWRLLPGRVLKMSVFVAAIILAHLPILVRNWQVDGSLAFSASSGGINFFIGNRAGASGKYDELDFVQSFDAWREAEGYRREAEARTGRLMSITDASSYWAGEATRDIFADPWGWIGLLGKKLWFTFRNEEIANNFSFEGTAGFAPTLHRIPLRWGLVWPLAAAGLLLIWPLGRKLLPWRLHNAAYLLTCIIFFSSSEYRFPLILFAFPLAAYFLVELWKLLERRTWGILALTCSIYVVGLGIANWPSRELPLITRPLMDYRNLGSVANLRGMYPEAVAHYAHALAVDDSDQISRVGLADALWALGNFDEAREEYERAGVLAPDEISGQPTEAFLKEIGTLATAGELDSALLRFDESFPRAESAPLEIWVARAKVEARAHRYLEAYHSMLRAHRLDPVSPEWLYFAAEYILETDDAISADSLYAEAIRRYPAFAPARIGRAFLAVETGNIQQADYELGQLRKIRIQEDSVLAKVDSLERLLGVIYDRR